MQRCQITFIIAWKMNTKSLLDRCQNNFYWNVTKLDPKWILPRSEIHFKTMPELWNDLQELQQAMHWQSVKSYHNYTKISEMYLKLAIENSHKINMKWSKMQPNGIQTATKMEPKGCLMATRMAHKPVQNDPGTPNWTSPSKLQICDNLLDHLGATQGSTLVPTSVKVPWKSN